MQLFKPLLVVCAATVAIVPFSLRAADTEAQIRAREALEKKMSETQPQEPAPPAKVPATKPKKTPAQPAPKKQTPPPAQPAQPAPAPIAEPISPPPPVPAPAVQATPPPAAPETLAQPPAQRQWPRPDSEQVAKAREALRQKMDELNTQQPAQPTAPAVTAQHAPSPAQPAPTATIAAPPPAAPPQAPPPVVAEPPQQPAPIAAEPAQPQPSPTVSKADQKRQSAQERREAQRQADKVAANKSKHQLTPPPQPKPVAAQRAPQPGFQPMGAPALPISADKQQRLTTLLHQYQADQITPSQYHEARAKIMAEP
jgi:hypothetical protein